MEAVSYDKFKEDTGKVFIILMVILGFMAFKLVTGHVTTEYILIFTVSLVSFIAARSLLVYSKKMLEDPNFRMSAFTIAVLHFFLTICLGALSIYVFAIKGVYGTYKLFSSFNWFLLLFRIAIISMSVILANAVSNIQTVLTWLSKNTWTKIY